ncbi:MAG: cofactor-independent phosphoglycerate mutase [Clostridia bacterium]|nr:cofactor-independent phosphoglycerate mutase [Clostridia bacterium]
MKYCVLICDGMADYKIEELGNKTPMEAANKPTMDNLAKASLCGTVSNVPEGMVPESDTANLAILSYDPKVYSRGRSPLEATAMGLKMRDDETAFRCNVVTLSENGLPYEEETILDHSADEITTAEADELMKALNEHLGTDYLHFYTGVSYRHCILWQNAPDFRDFMRPHDIPGRVIGEYLPPEPFLSLMKKSREVLEHHPVNEARRARGLRVANSIWLWSPGKKPSLPSFSEKWGISGTVISAVDLIKGIGKCAEMDVIDVDGATGNIHTNYKGKADAAIDAFKNGTDLVYIHVEAPDECGHRGELDNKVKSIEYIDERILKPVLSYLESCGDDFRILVLPDHPTPMVTRTHAMDPVPFFMYDSAEKQAGVDCYTEENCVKANNYIPHGYNLFDSFIVKK